MVTLLMVLTLMTMIEFRIWWTEITLTITLTPARMFGFVGGLYSTYILHGASAGAKCKIELVERVVTCAFRARSLCRKWLLQNT